MKSYLTASSLRTWRACPRLYYYKYELKLSTNRDVTELKFGSLIHNALEVWWNEKKNGTDPSLILQKALNVIIFSNRLPDQDPVEAIRAEVLMMIYHHRWINEPLDPILVESEFEMKLINPETGSESRTFDQAGKTDVIVRNRDDGELYLMEHKTTTQDVSGGSEYWRHLRLDEQINMYFEGAARLGYTVRGCIYDVLSKPLQRRYEATPVENRKYKLKTGELYANQRAEDEPLDDFRQRLIEVVTADPQAYLSRSMVVRFEDEIKEHQYDTWAYGEQIRNARVKQRFPRNSNSCFNYHRQCEFFDACTGVFDITDRHIYQIRTKAHSELNLESKEKQ